METVPARFYLNPEAGSGTISKALKEEVSDPQSSNFLDAVSAQPFAQVIDNSCQGGVTQMRHCSTRLWDGISQICAGVDRSRVA
jgi:hypothetical protein